MQLKTKQLAGAENIRTVDGWRITWDPKDEEGYYTYPHIKGNEKPGLIAIDGSGATPMLELHIDQGGRRRTYELGDPTHLTFLSLVDRVLRAQRGPARGGGGF
jgi:hypothetical protein